MRTCFTTYECHKGRANLVIWWRCISELKEDFLVAIWYGWQETRKRNCSVFNFNSWFCRILHAVFSFKTMTLVQFGSCFKVSNKYFSRMRHACSNRNIKEYISSPNSLLIMLLWINCNGKCLIENVILLFEKIKWIHDSTISGPLSGEELWIPLTKGQ